MPAASGAPVFVHFMPLPLRAEGKKNLPWIVHTSDGSGCHEADHVLFKTLIGFETFEGCPPDQGSCKCTVSNHHLRGHGRVRWEGATAVIECADDDENKLVNVASFRDDAKRQAREVTSIRADLRRLKEEGDKASVHTGNLKARVTELERTKLEYENGPMREHEALKRKHALLSQSYRTLTAKHRALADGLPAPLEPTAPPPPPRKLARRRASVKQRARAQQAADGAGAQVPPSGLDEAVALGDDELEPDDGANNDNDDDDEDAELAAELRAAQSRAAAGAAVSLGQDVCAQLVGGRVALRRVTASLLLAAASWGAARARRSAAAGFQKGGAHEKQPAAYGEGETAAASPRPSHSSSSSGSLRDSPGRTAVDAGGLGAEALASTQAALRALLQSTGQQVCVLTAAGARGERTGSTISSLVCCSMAPPMVCLNVGRGSRLARALGLDEAERNERGHAQPQPAQPAQQAQPRFESRVPFLVHVLGAGGEALARRFSQRGADERALFGEGLELGSSGPPHYQPVLLGGEGRAVIGRADGERRAVIGWMECATAHALGAGNHWVITAHVLRIGGQAAAPEPVAPLLYHGTRYKSLEPLPPMLPMAPPARHPSAGATRAQPQPLQDSAHTLRTAAVRAAATVAEPHEAQRGGAQPGYLAQHSPGRAPPSLVGGQQHVASHGARESSPASPFVHGHFGVRAGSGAMGVAAALYAQSARQPHPLARTLPSQALRGAAYGAVRPALSVVTLGVGVAPVGRRGSELSGGMPGYGTLSLGASLQQPPYVHAGAYRPTLRAGR